MPEPQPPTNLDFPIQLSQFTKGEITWLAAKSSQTGKSTAEVARDLISRAAKAAGFVKSTKELPTQPA